ncbi:hypothetical protein HUU53_02925, partial [Candidatus Micrarchaeota archaeon]|nr:hypothetical protein [Candidatus Micrarchaeota archaeon]
SAYNSFKTCKPAKIAVSDDSVVSCKLSASEPTIEDGYNSRIQLNYRGLGGSTSTSSVDSVNVLVNVVGQKTEFVPLVSENLYLTLPSQVEVTPGSSTSFNLVVKNNFYYSLKSVLISTKNAPSGVFIQPVAPFALDAGEERNIRVIVTADKTALIGTHSFTIKADSPSASSKDYSVTLKVKELSPKELLVSVSQPRFEFTQVGDNQEILMTIPVTNNEAGAFSYRVLMDLPEGWSFEAQDFSLAGGESTDLIVKLIAPNYEDKDYEVALRLQSGDKLKVIPLTVPAKSRSSLTGLFTAFNSIESIIILFIVIGLLIAGYFALKSRNTEVGGEQVK